MSNVANSITSKQLQDHIDICSLMEVRDEINSLNTKKSNVANSITSKQLQDHIDICSH